MTACVGCREAFVLRTYTLFREGGSTSFLNPGCLSSPEEVRLGSKGRFQVGLEDKDSPAGEVTSSWEGDTPLPAAESLSSLGTGMGGHRHRCEATAVSADSMMHSPHPPRGTYRTGLHYMYTLGGLATPSSQETHGVSSHVHPHILMGVDTPFSCCLHR